MGGYLTILISFALLLFHKPLFVNASRVDYSSLSAARNHFKGPANRRLAADRAEFIKPSSGNYSVWEQPFRKELERLCKEPGRFSSGEIVKVTPLVRNYFVFLRNADGFSPFWDHFVVSKGADEFNFVSEVWTYCRRWVVMFFVGIATLVLAILFSCANSRSCRSCFAAMCCRLFCVDKPREPLKDISSAIKIGIGLIYVVFGFALLLTFSLVMIISSNRARVGLESVTCDVHQGFNGLFFGDHERNSYQTLGQLPWRGIVDSYEIIKTVEDKEHMSKIITDGYADVVADTRADIQASSTTNDYLSQSVKLNSAFLASHNHKLFAEAALNGLGLMLERVSSEFEAKSADGFAQLHQELTSGSDIQKLQDFVAPVVAQIEDASDGLGDAFIEVNTALNNYGELAMKIAFWVGVGMGVIGLLVFLLGACTYGIFAKHLIRGKNPGHSAKGLLSATYVTFGFFAAFGFIVASTIFIAVAVGSDSCKLAEDVVGTESTSTIDNLWLSGTAQSIINECIGYGGKGNIAQALNIQTDIDEGRKQLDTVRTETDKRITDTLGSLRSEEEGKKVQDELSAVGWIILSDPINDGNNLYGVQTEDRYVDCRYFGNMPPCSATTTQLKIKGLRTLIGEINNPLTTPTRYCLKDTGCDGSSFTLSGSTSINSNEIQDSATGITDATARQTWLRNVEIAIQKSALLELNTFSCLPDTSNCDLRTFALGSSSSLDVPMDTYILQQSESILLVLESVDGKVLAPHIQESAIKPLFAKFDNALDLSDMDCKFMGRAFKHILTGVCSIWLPEISIIPLSLSMYWISGLVMMITTFSVFLYSHNLLFIEPAYTGDKDSDLVTSFGDELSSRMMGPSTEKKSKRSTKSSKKGDDDSMIGWVERLDSDEE